MRTKVGVRLHCREFDQLGAWWELVWTWAPHGSQDSEEEEEERSCPYRHMGALFSASSSSTFIPSCALRPWGIKKKHSKTFNSTTLYTLFLLYFYHCCIIHAIFFFIHVHVPQQHGVIKAEDLALPGGPGGKEGEHSSADTDGSSNESEVNWKEFHHVPALGYTPQYFHWVPTTYNYNVISISILLPGLCPFLWPERLKIQLYKNFIFLRLWIRLFFFF
jgi:hypothetical protein